MFFFRSTPAIDMSKQTDEDAALYLWAITAYSSNRTYEEVLAFVKRTRQKEQLLIEK